MTNRDNTIGALVGSLVMISTFIIILILYLSYDIFPMWGIVFFILNFLGMIIFVVNMIKSLIRDTKPQENDRKANI